MENLLFPVIQSSSITSIIIIALDILIECEISLLYVACMVYFLKHHLFVSFIMSGVSWILQFIIYCYILVDDLSKKEISRNDVYLTFIQLWIYTSMLAVIVAVIEIKIEELYLWIDDKYNMVARWLFVGEDVASGDTADGIEIV